MSAHIEDLSIDLETFSFIALPDTGVHIYAAHVSTGIWCMMWALPGEPVQTWTQGMAWPEAITDHVKKGGKLRSWNVSFERNVMGRTGVRRYGFPEWLLDPEHWICTMSEAASMALPQALGKAAPAVSLEIAKDAAGARTMMQLCQPRPSDGKLWLATDPGCAAKLDTLFAYCVNDVEVERQIAARLVRLQPEERQLWLLTERMNDQGVFIDRPLCEAAQAIVLTAQASLTDAIRKASDYALPGPNAVKQIVVWLAEQGVVTPNLDKAAVETLLAREDLAANVREVLEIRQAAAKSSTAKLLTMVTRQSADGFCKGMFRFHGAGTGRFSVSGLQLQNITKPDPTIDVDAAIEDIMAGDYRMVEAMHGNPMNAVSSILRGCITAPPGERMVSFDLAQVEIRVNAFLAGQEDAVQGFRDYDAGIGHDCYVTAACGIYGLEAHLIDKYLHRPTGKVAVLALGFMGGAGALMAMARAMGIDLAVVAANVKASATAGNIEAADKAWKDRGIKSGSPKVAWTTAELVKLAWRNANSRIVQYSYDLENGALEALRTPGKWIAVGEHVHYKKSGSFLMCRLPSGRRIYYPSARIGIVDTPWGTAKQSVVAKTQNINTQWVDRGLHGGVLIENVVQAASRDIMCGAMLRISRDQPEWKLSMSIHDELVVCCKPEHADLDAMCAVLATTPDYLVGLPLAAAGWIGSRFQK